MADWLGKGKSRRQQVRQRKVRVSGSRRAYWLSRVASWPVLSSVLFVVAIGALALVGPYTLGYSVGQRVEHPIYARVAFQIPDEGQTADDQTAARAKTPSYYALNDPALTFDRIRAELMRVYQRAADADNFEEYKTAMEAARLPAEQQAYERLRELSDEEGRRRFEQLVQSLPVEKEYVVRNQLGEPRAPKSVTNFIRVQLPREDGSVEVVDVPNAEVVPQGNKKALRGSAAAVARRFPLPALMSTVEAIVYAVFQEHPTILYDQERTAQAMREAADATPVAMRTFEAGQVLIPPGILETKEYELLRADRAAYEAFLREGGAEAMQERRLRFLRDAGLVLLVGLLSVGLLVYTAMHHPRVFQVRSRTLAFMLLVLGAVGASRWLVVEWPGLPELAYAPPVLAVCVLAIVYPQRLAIGSMCIVAVIVATVVDGGLTFLLPLFVGIAVAGYQLDEVRTRTKLPVAGVITAAAVMVAVAAGGFVERHSLTYVRDHVMVAGVSVMGAALVVSGMLPFVERMFRIATSLTLLEWRDPTRQLLQLLAREAPGTYNHSLVVGTLASAACDSIGANGLLAQVGALYHDIGKITKPAYFTENQEGRISRHENLAPTMSLLIILGHVKDGIEMAKEYKLPRVLHQFIAEHHGTTVVRYFHHMASEKQPQIARGRHDREVPESEFRYPGPKPQSRESAVLMLADGVEGAIRSLPDPTPGRIESIVHTIVQDRLNDGQFDDCDITLKELKHVEESLVKSLCSIYHGRVAYPKAQKRAAEAAPEAGTPGQPQPERVSV